MFSVPQPENENAVDGCPVVHVSDTADDLHHVLKALFDRSYCFVDSEPLSLDVIMAFLRLGRKYDIQQLYSEALTRLEFEFPLTLEQYDHSASSLTLILSNGAHRVGHTLVSAVINLGRENDILHIPPIAFYFICSSHTAKELLEASEQLEESAHELSVFDQRAVIKGWHSLVERQATETFKWLVQEDTFATICTGYACAKHRRNDLYMYWFPQVSCSALDAWQLGWEKDYCKACV